MFCVSVFGWQQCGWRDSEARVSKNAAHFGGLWRLLLKIEARQYSFNLSYGPSALIPAQQCMLKRSSLKPSEPSESGGRGEAAECREREIKREAVGGELVELFILREGSGKGKCAPIHQRQPWWWMGTRRDRLNILSGCEQKVHGYSESRCSCDCSLQMSSWSAGWALWMIRCYDIKARRARSPAVSVSEPHSPLQRWVLTGSNFNIF